MFYMINRPIYLNKLISFKDHEAIKVITGIRRCGKSSILALFAEYLKSVGVSNDNILQINFEDLQYGNMTYLELNNFIKEKLDSTEGKFYILLDEIQKIDKWELAVNSLRLDNRTDIYITGSNAYMLSSQLSTYLSGRYVEIKMQPLSFKEYLDFYKDSDISREAKFNNYLKYGGMPGLAIFKFNEPQIIQMLDGIFSTVLMKDIIEQADVRDPALITKITKFLADNVGNNVSINKIKNTLISQNIISKGMKPSTIDNYIMLLENAFVFYNANRYDIKGKEYLKTQGKYYMVDTGLRNYFIGFRGEDRGHLIENVVYMELLHRGYNVSIGKINDKEVDFVATKFNDKLYVQVTDSLMEDSTRVREFASLKAINDNFEKIILTLDNVFVGTNDEGIKVLNLIDWLVS